MLVTGEAPGTHLDLTQIGGQDVHNVDVAQILITFDEIQHQLPADKHAVQEYIGLTGSGGFNGSDLTVGIHGQEQTLCGSAVLDGFINQGDRVAGGLMVLNGGTEVHVVDPVGGAEQHRFLIGAEEEIPVHNHIPEGEPGADVLEAVGGTGKHKHAALFLIQPPFPSHVQMIRQRAVVGRGNDTHGVNAGIHHGGQGKVDKAVTSGKGDRGHGTFFNEFAVVFVGIVGGNQTNNTAHNTCLLNRCSGHRPAGRWGRRGYPGRRWCLPEWWHAPQ